MQLKTKTMLGMGVGYLIGDLVNAFFGLNSLTSLTGVVVSAACAFAGIFVAFKLFA